MTTFASRYIKKRNMKPDDVKKITEDIQLYNKMSQKIVKKLRTKRDKSAESIHCEYKRTYKVSDYFVNSAERKAKGIRNAAEAALKLDIETKKNQITQMEKKVEDLDQRLDNLNIMKESLIERSKARKAKQPVPEFQTYTGSEIYTDENSDGTTTFTKKFKRVKGKPKREPLIFDDDYLFESQYLNPTIHQIQVRKHNIQSRIHNTKGHLKTLEQRLENKRFTICFGGKKLSSAQYTTYAGRHEDWKHTYRKRRTWEMQLVGRCDASQGNFMVRYDTETHQLVYKGHDGTSNIVMNNVIFPYGQELVNTAVNTSRQWRNIKNLSEQERRELWEKLPVTWSIKDCGNAFQVKCMIQVPDNPNINTFYGSGCIGFDMNYDRLAVSEIDQYGHLVTHYVVPFNPEGKTSNQITNMLSEALEQVFHHAEKVGKPVVMEDIDKLKNKDSLYSSAKRNRKISMFAYDKMKALAMHKSQKYGVGLKQINPAYTSQIGKMKYMSRFGVSIHEAASYVIARRGMRFREKVPNYLYALLPKKRKTTHHWSQWALISTKLKSVPTHKFYQKKKYDVKDLDKLKEKLIA